MACYARFQGFCFLWTQLFVHIMSLSVLRKVTIAEHPSRYPKGRSHKYISLFTADKPLCWWRFSILSAKLRESNFPKFLPKSTSKHICSKFGRRPIANIGWQSEPIFTRVKRRRNQFMKNRHCGGNSKWHQISQQRFWKTRALISNVVYYWKKWFISNFVLHAMTDEIHHFLRKVHYRDWRLLTP